MSSRMSVSVTTRESIIQFATTERFCGMQSTTGRHAQMIMSGHSGKEMKRQPICFSGPTVSTSSLQPHSTANMIQRCSLLTTLIRIDATTDQKTCVGSLDWKMRLTIQLRESVLSFFVAATYKNSSTILHVLDRIMHLHRDLSGCEPSRLKRLRTQKTTLNVGRENRLSKRKLTNRESAHHQ